MMSFRRFAVRVGVEPTRGDSTNDNISRLCGQPISFVYLELRTHETSGCVCLALEPFHHLTIFSYYHGVLLLLLLCKYASR